MIKYQIEVSEPAEIDMDNAFYHLLLRAPKSATMLRDGLAESLRSLSEMPNRCGLAPETGQLDRPIRQLLYRHGKATYRILFLAFESVEDSPALVRVVRVLHGSQQSLISPADEE